MNSSDPLDLQLHVDKPRVLVGEGIVLRISHHARRDLDMETVELNQNRTQIRITRTDLQPPQVRVLTGADYAALFKVSSLQEIGRSFKATSGTTWDSELDVWQYTRPLEAGHYRIELSYRYGADENATVRTNHIELDVVAANLLSNEFRWLGATYARDDLGSFWTAEDGQMTQWFYQTASKRDPGIVAFAVDLGLNKIDAVAPPRLAHLNDIGPFHFERYAVWLETERLGWLRVQMRGRLEDPSYVAHGLAKDRPVQIADPPLQRRAGGASFVLVGYDAQAIPTASLVEVDANGSAHKRLMVLGGGGTLRHAAVVWSEREDTPEGALYLVYSEGGKNVLTRHDLASGSRRQLWESKDEVLALEVDQWMGRGHALLAVREADWIRVLRWDVAETSVAENRAEYDVKNSQPALGKLVHAAPLDAAEDLAMLFETVNGLTLLASGSRTEILKRESETNELARLVATPRNGIYLSRKGGGGVEYIQLLGRTR